ncbi:hypothetical protein BASA84_001177 [Batrachochytrium salamandrivorans]|nr:hypothetical protein BASA84_001177 [Batrachochytrium salamandrivorans]
MTIETVSASAMATPTSASKTEIASATEIAVVAPLSSPTTVAESISVGGSGPYFVQTTARHHQSHPVQSSTPNNNGRNSIQKRHQSLQANTGNSGNMGNSNNNDNMNATIQPLRHKSSPTSSYLVKRSVVSLKKGLISYDKFMVLCAPISVQDIQSVYELLFVSDPSRPVDTRSIPWLGNVAFAAVKATPLLVILPSETRVDSPVFIHFDEVRSISDEVALSSACTFVLHLAKTDLRFVCKTSTDYVEWIRYLTIAFEIAASSFLSSADDLCHRANVNSAMLQQNHHLQFMQPTSQTPPPGLAHQHYGASSIGGGVSDIGRLESLSQLYASTPNNHLASPIQQQYGPSKTSMVHTTGNSIANGGDRS